MILKDRVAIVTGGAIGIGRVYAETLAANGAKVIIADIHQDGKVVAESIKKNGGYAISIPTDVSNEESVHNLALQAKKEFGKVDILVNNAALFAALYPMRDFTEIDVERWDKVMAVNVRGIFLTCKTIVPMMREKKYGRIINISSNVFWRGLPGFLDYSTSKAAIIGLTRALVHEVGKDGITVNCIAPGYTQSSTVIKVQDEDIGQDPYEICKSQAIARPQVPKDLCGALLFLASDASSFITGQTLVVDGGFVLN